MVPCTIRSFSSYLFGIRQYLLNKLTLKIKNKFNNYNYNYKKVIISNVSYLSNGWDELFLRRIKEKYNINIDIIEK